MCFPPDPETETVPTPGQTPTPRVRKAYLSLLYHTLSSLPPPNILYTSLLHRYKPYTVYTPTPVPVKRGNKAKCTTFLDYLFLSLNPNQRSKERCFVLYTSILHYIPSRPRRHHHTSYDCIGDHRSSYHARSYNTLDDRRR